MINRKTTWSISGKNIRVNEIWKPLSYLANPLGITDNEIRLIYNPIGNYWCSKIDVI